MQAGAAVGAMGAQRATRYEPGPGSASWLWTPPCSATGALNWQMVQVGWKLDASSVGWACVTCTSVIATNNAGSSRRATRTGVRMLQ